MKLPAFAPPEFDFLQSSENEVELFNRISSSFPVALQFLELAGDDDSWCEVNRSFVIKFLKWFTHLFYSEQINLDLARKVAEIIHKKNTVLGPFLSYDMMMNVGGEELPGNTLMLATSSAYFNGLIQQMRERQAGSYEKKMRLANGDPSQVRQLLEVIHQGTKDLWRKKSQELESILTQSRSWDLNQMAGTSEEQLTQFLKPENALDTLVKSRKKQWIGLSKESSLVYNELSTGLKLYIDPHGELVAKFLDLKRLTTLVEYAKIAKYVGICHFLENLPALEEFEDVLKMSPNLIGLDFSDSIAAPFSYELIPSKLQILNLSDAGWVGNQDLIKFFKKAPGINRLYLSKAIGVNLVGWMALSSLTDLKELDLSDVRQIDDTEINLVASALMSLDHLNISGCRSLSYMGIQDVLKAATRLTYLNLSKTAVGDQNLSEMSLRQSRLEHLDLSYTKNVTERAIISLIRSRPNIIRLNLTGSSLGEERVNTLAKAYPHIRFS